MKKIHFISGLPRSGTTLLSSILNQNPRFSASISGPLSRFVKAIITESQAHGGYRFQCPVEKRKELILNLIGTYYNTSNEVAFDTNRGWTYSTPLLADLYPDAKVICCVRSIPWIIDSFEQLFARNPYDVPKIFPAGNGASVFSRAAYLLQPSSPIGFAYDGLKEAISGHARKNLFVLQYDHLARNPEMVMRRIYEFIGEEWFNHDFDNVEAAWDEFDADLNIKGLHNVRRKVQFQEREPIIPRDMFNEYRKLDFW